MNDNIIFHQLFEKESSTYTYLLGDPSTMEAIIIDPVVEMVERDMKLLEDLGLKLRFVLDTHVHADHVTASGELRRRTQAKVGLNSAYGLSCPDVQIQDGQKLNCGSIVIEAIHTPGHTSGCMSYKVGNMVFTGDALLIRGCGRTDFQGGSSDELYSSVRNKLFTLPAETTVFPAHDYKGFTKSSIDLERRFNPRLNLKVPLETFKEIMANLNLPYPKKIDEAVPANKLCGFRAANVFTSQETGLPSLMPEELDAHLPEFKLVDVRRPDEFNAELGHIPDAKLKTLGVDLNDFLKTVSPSEKIVFICRSGKRSAEATTLALQAGISGAINLEGGMLAWNEHKLPIVRDRAGS
jgi:sulfur dioxygenase